MTSELRINFCLGWNLFLKYNNWYFIQKNLAKIANFDIDFQDWNLVWIWIESLIII